MNLIVYPGVTEDFCVPILEKISKLNYNQEFHCGYSPERISPGDDRFTLNKMIKLQAVQHLKLLTLLIICIKKLLMQEHIRLVQLRLLRSLKLLKTSNEM